MKKKDIPYYQDYISDALLEQLKKEWQPVPNIPELKQVGKSGGLENADSLNFICELYKNTKAELNQVLEQRRIDREFIDQRTKACFELNESLQVDFLDPDYETMLGHEDSEGRIVLWSKE